MIDQGVRVFLCGLCVSAVLGVLASCSSDASSKKITAPTASPVVSSNDGQESLAPLSITPPGTDDRPLQPGQSGTAYTPDGLPALLPSKGISADQLFAEKIKDEKKRMDRMENAIIDLKREFDAMKPAIIRLSAVESDMQDLITQLQTLTGTPPEMVEASEAGDVVMPAVPAAPVKVAEPVVRAPTGNAVTGIRSGMQGAASRLVLDVSGDLKYTRDLDNTEHVLMVEMTGVGLAAPGTGNFAKSSLLKSWTMKKTETGVVAAIQLSGPASITYEKKLPGKDGSGNRLVLDLTPQ